jgi:hypothetical protein
VRVVDPREKHRQDRQSFPGPLVDPGLAGTDLLLPGQVLGPDRTRRDPLCPATRVFHRPLGDVEVEGTHRGQVVQGAGAAFADLDHLPLRPGDPATLGHQALLPRRSDLGRQVHRVDAGIWWRSRSRQNSPPRMRARLCIGGVVQHWLTFLRVADQQVTHRTACDAVSLDQLRWVELAAGSERTHRRRAVRLEDASVCSTWQKPMPLSLRTDRLSMASDSCSQSPTVTSRNVPPLTLTLTPRIVAAAQRGRLYRPSRRGRVARLPSSVKPARSQPGSSSRPDSAGARGEDPIQAGAGHVGADQHQRGDAQVA